LIQSLQRSPTCRRGDRTARKTKKESSQHKHGGSKKKRGSSTDGLKNNIEKKGGMKGAGRHDRLTSKTHHLS